MTTIKAFCHACGAPFGVGAQFCEVCGVKANAPLLNTTPVAATAAFSQAPPPLENLAKTVTPFQRVADVHIPTAAVRGRILRDTNIGMGLLSLGGRQVPFSLEANWRGDIAPVVQMTVDVVLDEAGNPVTVAPVSDKDVAQEKLKALSGDLSRKFQDQMPLAKTYAHAIGTPVLIAIGVLLISWIWLPMATVRIRAGLSQSATMFDVLGLVNMGGDLQSFGSNYSGSSGIYGFICVLAMLAPAAPAFIRHRYITLSYFAPLLFLLVLGFAMYMKVRSFANAAQESMGSFGGAQMAKIASAMMDQILAAVSIGFGVYVSLAAALFLAVHGGIKFLASR